MSTADRLTPQALIDQWRLHPSPEVGSCANQLAGWLRTQDEEKKDVPRWRAAWQAVSEQHQKALEQIVVVSRERDEYKTLAAIGAWHKDCRPNREMAARELAKSQAIIDMLADRITELESRLREVISLIDDPCPYDKATTLTIARQALPTASRGGGDTRPQPAEEI